MRKTLVLHLVSHASGELVETLARKAVAQLEGVEVERIVEAVGGGDAT
jgi:regulator of PEP synthase PpsR (kinase-PPPase family)